MPSTDHIGSTFCRNNPADGNASIELAIGHAVPACRPNISLLGSVQDLIFRHYDTPQVPWTQSELVTSLVRSVRTAHEAWKRSGSETEINGMLPKPEAWIAARCCSATQQLPGECAGLLVAMGRAQVMQGGQGDERAALTAQAAETGNASDPFNPFGMMNAPGEPVRVMLMDFDEEG